MIFKIKRCYTIYTIIFLTSQCFVIFFSKSSLVFLIVYKIIIIPKLSILVVIFITIKFYILRERNLYNVSYFTLLCKHAIMTRFVSSINVLTFSTLCTKRFCFGWFGCGWWKCWSHNKKSTVYWHSISITFIAHFKILFFAIRNTLMSNDNLMISEIDEYYTHSGMLHCWSKLKSFLLWVSRLSENCIFSNIYMKTKIIV